MNFQYLAGGYTDRLFSRLGLHNTLVKYKSLLISPNPIVSHEGPTPINESPVELGGSESLDTYTVSLPADTIKLQMAGMLAYQLQQIEAKYKAGTYDYDRKVIEEVRVKRDYQLEYAIAAYREWELSTNKGFTWKRFRLQGDPKREAVRWVLKFVSAGDYTEPVAEWINGAELLTMSTAIAPVTETYRVVPYRAEVCPPVTVTTPGGTPTPTPTPNPTTVSDLIYIKPSWSFVVGPTWMGLGTTIPANAEKAFIEIDAPSNEIVVAHFHTDGDNVSPAIEWAMTHLGNFTIETRQEVLDFRVKRANLVTACTMRVAYYGRN